MVEDYSVPNATEVLLELKKGFQELRIRDDARRDELERRIKMIVRNLFGEGSYYLKDLEQIDFDPGVHWTGMTDKDYMPSWEAAKHSYVNLISSILEELALFKPTTDATRITAHSDGDTSPKSSTVFIVHGHDEAMKQSVARVLEKLGLIPVILHEQANRGRTILEKFMDHSQHAGYAVVLLSPDDLAFRIDQKPSQAVYRSRQNVVFEFGFFLGVLGRDRVTVLHKNTDNFDMPTDLAGVLYTPFDENGNWRFDLVKELHSAGYEVDSNKLLSL